MEPMEELNVHHRALKLKDVALGAKKLVALNSELASASYDCALDSLFALHTECKNASSLGKDKNVQKFTKKYDKTISTLKKLRMCADDFEVKSTIGRGHFGEVVVCHEKSTRDVFAMKIMKKAHILQQSDAAFFNAERDIMAWSNSPWLTSLHYAFQDDKSLYLVMDFHPGGDLLNVMERKEGSMQEEEVRFYLSEIAVGLNDLHGLGFVHRDMKPDNVLITRSGHIKLVDFGSVAVLNDKGKVMDAQLPVGTPEYIAPEVLTSLSNTADYGTCCDWWSLGVMAYELLYEATPFEGDATSKIYNNIMNYKNSLTFPEEPKTSMEKEAHHLIKSLLTEMDKRLAYDGILQHPFFGQTDWDHLLDAIPPHIPKVVQPDDVSNFDVFEPLKDADLKYPDFPGKKSGFSGRTLPFIGFTFNRHMASMSEYFGSPTGDSVQMKGASSEVRKENVAIVKKELEEVRRKTIILEQECEVYRSQLEDYHRRLEMERSDRRVSDSRALQLLQEVKEKGKVAQQLRQEQTRSTEVEYSAVVEQLERERKEASERAKKLHQKVKEMQEDRDATHRKMADYKSRLAALKESSSKETADLQAKVMNVSSESSSKLSEAQKRFQEIHKRYTEALDKVKSAESAKRKAEFGLQKLQTNLNEYSTTTADINQQLKELKSINDSLQSKVDCDSKASDDLRKQSVVLSKQVKDLETQLEEAYSEKSSLRSSQQAQEGQVKELVDQLEEKKNEVQRAQDLLQQEKKSMAKEHMRKDEEVAKLEANCSSMESRLMGMEDKKRMSTNEKLKSAVDKAARLEKENGNLKAKMDASNKALETMTAENESIKTKLHKVEQRHKAAISDLRAELRSVQGELSDAATKALQQKDQMREARKTKREVDQRNESLTVQLKEGQRECEMLKKQLKDSRSEVEELCTSQDRLKQAQTEIEILKGNNESLKNEAAATQTFIKDLTNSSEQAHSVAYSYKSKFDSQEMSTTLFDQKVKILEQELAESNGAMEEAQKQIEKLNLIKDVIEKDLETAEMKVDTLAQSSSMEKKEKMVAEQKLSKLAGDMEKMIVDHSGELQRLSGQLVSQKELAGKYSNKVLEVEKEMRLKALALREVQRELITEKAVSSKFYDEIQSKSRELCKLKAAHMKLVKEMQDQNSALAQREQNLKEQRQVNEKHQLQETRLQATISQQHKLIDFLQGGSTPPDSKGTKGFGKIKKGLKLGRKRDPAKDIAEWNKLKGIAGKGNVVQSTSSTSIASTSSSSAHYPAPPSSSSSSSQLPVPPSSSFLTTTSSDSYTVTLSNDPTGTSVVSLDDNHTYGEVGGAMVDRPPTPGTEIIVSGNGEEVEVSGGPPDKVIAQHNIPHRFRIVSKSGLRSHSTCAACRGPIKQLQKLNKCDYCPIVCHTQCVASMPNNCGLPEEMSAYVQMDFAAPTPKKARLDQDPKPSVVIRKLTGKETKKKARVTKKKPPERRGALLLRIAKNLSGLDNNNSSGSNVGNSNVQPSEDVELTSNGTQAESKESNMSVSVDQNGTLLESSKNSTDGAGEAINGTKNGLASPMERERERSRSPVVVRVERMIENIYCAGFDSSKVVKMEKMTQPRNGIMAEGWLVLTHNILSFYDRDPRGVTRKPINRFILNKPGMAYVIITGISRPQLPHVSSATLINAFGLEIYSSSSSSELYWVAPNLQSKIDWVEELQRILGQHSSPVRGGGGGGGEVTKCAGARDNPLEEISKEKDVNKKSRRELKEVKIVPLPTPPKRQKTEEDDCTSAQSSFERYPTRRTRSTNPTYDYSDCLDLSIRSSMLNTSSDSSYV